MRLTLRTLLAYLDGILESKDAEDLGKKVEESEYATGLVHRVRDVMRRLRLGAPSLTDRGPGLDPNTVAEYLDNTLAPERVTDFEKVCLDSDTHLAEVASCHQILALVLGEPAEVDPASRQRMYDVQAVHAGAKPPPTLPTASAIPAASAAAPPLSLDLEIGDAADRRPRPKPTVPEYLRESQRRRGWVPIAAVVVVAVCVVVMVLMALGQFEPGTVGGNLLASLGIATAPQEPKETAARGPNKDEKGDEESGNGEAAPANGNAAEPGNEPAVKSGTGPIQQPAAKSPADGSGQKKTPTQGADAAPPTANGAKILPPPPGTTPKPDGSSATPPGKAPVTKGPAKPPPEIEMPGLPVGPGPKAAGDGGKEPAPLPPAPAEPEPVGGLVSSEQVLLSDNPQNGWTRVAANQRLVPQQLIALPTYRPKVGLTTGVTLEILGGSRVELLDSSGKDLTGVRVLYGRVVLMPLAKGGMRLRVEFGDHRGTITFVDAASVAALDVHHLHAPGTNPESGPPRVTADLFVTGGAISWDETVDKKAAETKRLAPSERLAFDAQVTGTPTPLKEVPRWIAADGTIRAMSPREQLDRSAAVAIAQALPTDQPARIKLLELITSRPQKEVKWLSLRCLGYVGQFHDMVAVLNDATRKTEWPDYIDALRMAVDRDAETAAAVRTALEKEHPQQAAELYRMLWGYTDKQLADGDDGKGGEDAKLVRGLDDDLLAVRVLSYWNLRDITGKGDVYRPEFTAARRQQPVRNWRKRLDAKEIRFAAAERRTRPPLHENVNTPTPAARQ
jgi:hypothetical protein